PPGTSKWNAIEHRLFSFISVNWRGRPLTDYETIVNLIRATTNRKGLTVDCELDERAYPLGLRVSDADFAALNLFPDSFHGDWNYEIRPQNK
ncbi:MAG: ISAzo13 family transposase, partial [Opitutaceae bacterium]|nr:ISAzo13 family transposase [Opitutaceae bacterium]